MRPLAQAGEIRIESFLSETDERSLANDVLDGLTRPFKEIPAKHFYDARGSELFEQICELPEYYPTRTEREILTARADGIVEAYRRRRAGRAGVGIGREGADPARGDVAGGDASPLCSPRRVRERARGRRDRARRGVRWPVDPRRHRRLRAASRPASPRRDGTPRIVALLGGTIGNFLPGTRRRLLREIGRLLGPRDRLLLGTDLVKDPAVIEAAYDDSEGVTAEFNRNVLHVINRELDADFCPRRSTTSRSSTAGTNGSRCACAPGGPAPCWSPTSGCGSTSPPARSCAPRSARSSRAERVEDDFEAAGLALERWYTDPDGLFALSLAAPVGFRAMRIGQRRARRRRCLGSRRGHGPPAPRRRRPRRDRRPGRGAR